MVERDSPADGDADGSADRSAPLDELADRVRSKAESGAEPGVVDDAASLDGYFEEESFDEPEAADPWVSIDTGAAFGEGVETTDKPDEHTVPKRSYCESCEHFSEPPEVSCTHPGTTIVELPDIDHVRVRNCPIVAERQTLGEAGHETKTPRTFGRR